MNTEIRSHIPLLKLKSGKPRLRPVVRSSKPMRLLRGELVRIRNGVDWLLIGTVNQPSRY